MPGKSQFQLYLSITLAKLAVGREWAETGDQLGDYYRNWDQERWEAWARYSDDESWESAGSEIPFEGRDEKTDYWVGCKLWIKDKSHWNERSEASETISKQCSLEDLDPVTAQEVCANVRVLFKLLGIDWTNLKNLWITSKYLKIPKTYMWGYNPYFCRKLWLSGDIVLFYW